MKHETLRVLAGLFFCGLVTALAFPVLGFEDPFDEKLKEAEERIDSAGQSVSEALERRNAPDGLKDLLTALDEFDAAYADAKPSKLDMWEARQRLLEIIHDSDDETAFDLYLTVAAHLRRVDELGKMAERSYERLERAQQARASRGVDLTPEN